MEPIRDILKNLPPRDPNYQPETSLDDNTLSQLIKAQDVEYAKNRIFNELYHLYQNCTLSDFPKLKKQIEKWLEVGSGIYVYGGVGVGKTHLALSCLKWQFDRGEKGWFWPVDELLDHFRWFISTNDSTGLVEDVARWCNIPLLVLDDLGVQKATVWADEKLYEIINHRWQRRDRLITVVTSNWSHTELEEKAREEVIGERIVSRIIGMCEVVHIEGKDRRLTKCPR